MTQAAEEPISNADSEQRARSLGSTRLSFSRLQVTGVAILGVIRDYFDGAEAASAIISAGLALLAARLALLDWRTLRLSHLDLFLLGALGLIWTSWQFDGDPTAIAEAALRALAYATLFWTIQKIYWTVRDRHGLG